MMPGKESRLFKSREDAGKQLAIMVAEEYNRSNPLILGIPRGGVEVAYYLAERMNTEYSVVVAKKLSYPDYEELAFGSLAEDGSSYISPVGQAKLNPDIIQKSIEQKQKEIQRRVETYRKGEPLPDMNNRTVVITDDGIATGATIIPLIKMCKNKGASKVIIAAPIAPKDMNPLLMSEADDVLTLAQPDNFQSVGQFYENFQDLSDEDVLQILKKQGQY